MWIKNNQLKVNKHSKTAQFLAIFFDIENCVTVKDLIVKIFHDSEMLISTFLFNFSFFYIIFLTKIFQTDIFLYGFLTIISLFILFFNIFSFKQSLCFFKNIEEDSKKKELSYISDYNLITRTYYKLYNIFVKIETYLNTLKDNTVKQIMAIYLIIVYSIYTLYFVRNMLGIFESNFEFHWFTFVIGSLLLLGSILFHFLMIEVDMSQGSNKDDIATNEYYIGQKSITILFYRYSVLKILNNNAIIGFINHIISCVGWTISFIYLNVFLFFERNNFDFIDKIKDYYDNMKKNEIIIFHKVIQFLFLSLMYCLHFRYTIVLFVIMAVNHIINKGEPSYRFNKKYVKFLDIVHFLILISIFFYKIYMTGKSIYYHLLNQEQMIWLKFYIFTTAYIFIGFIIAFILFILFEKSSKIELVKTNNLADIILKQINEKD